MRSLAVQLERAMQIPVPALPEFAVLCLIEMLLVLWCCFLGAYASAKLKERPWLLVQLIKRKNTLGLSTQSQVCEALSSLLYTDRLLKNVLSPTWEEIDEFSEDRRI